MSRFASRPDVTTIIRGFYGIVNVTPDGPDPVEAAASMARGGCRCVQLRHKGAPKRDLVMLATALRQIATIMGFSLIIDDDAEVAAQIGADGVHVGQADLDCAEARRIVGPDRFVGVSTHNEAELRAAIVSGADYVGFGPIFPTSSKEDPDPVVGIEGLRAALSISTVPIVAIGGVTLSNAREVAATGVHALTSIEAVYSSGDIQSAVESFFSFFRR